LFPILVSLNYRTISFHVQICSEEKNYHCDQGFFLFFKFDIKNLAKLSNKIAKLIEFSQEKQKIKTFSQFVLKKQLRLEKITLMWL